MPTIEKRGRSVDDAIASALEDLGARIEDVSIEILEEPNKGLLGVIGKKQALVRVSTKEKPQDLVKAKLTQLLDAMKIEYEIDRVQYEPGYVRINIQGKDMGLLIGRKGETLNAVQFLVGLMVSREMEENVRVALDVEDYRLKREESLRALAQNLSEKVKRTRRSVVMRPMSPQERRIIHTTLQGDPEIVTFSQGEEPNRKVVISLKK